MGAPVSAARRVLAIALFVDGTISLAFGAATMVFQTEIFSTAVDLGSAGAAGNGDTLIESALQTLSGYYIAVGAILLVLAGLPFRFAGRLACIIALQHAFMAYKGIVEADHAWVTGNPWYDVVIHTAFAVTYAACLVFGMRGTRTKTATVG